MRCAAVMSETDHALNTGCLLLSPINQMQWLVNFYYSILFMLYPPENVCSGSNVFHPLQALPSRPPMPALQRARHLTKANSPGCWCLVVHNTITWVLWRGRRRSRSAAPVPGTVRVWRLRNCWPRGGWMDPKSIMSRVPRWVMEEPIFLMSSWMFWTINLWGNWIWMGKDP